MVFTKSEAELYARLTLKQWGVSHIKVVISDVIENSPKTMGLFSWEDGETITIKTKCLERFITFDYVLKHELAHALDYKERGSLHTSNGRANFHGANFHKWCKKLCIPVNALVPVKYHV